MNKLLLIAVILFVSFLSYVVFAVSQEASGGKAADEIVIALINPEVEKISPDAKLSRSPEEKKFVQLAAARRFDHSPCDLERAIPLARCEARETNSLDCVTWKGVNQLGTKLADSECSSCLAWDYIFHGENSLIR